MPGSRMIEAPGANHAEAVVPLRLSSGDLLRGLGCGIDVTRPLLGILHEGHFVRGVPSILRPATDDEHDWIELAGAAPARHFGEQLDRTEHIDVVGGRRRIARVRNEADAGKMKNRLGLAGIQCLLYRVGIADVAVQPLHRGHLVRCKDAGDWRVDAQRHDTPPLREQGAS